MKHVFLIIAFFSITFSYSQTEEKVVKNTLMDFKEAFNNSDYSAIFNLFNAKMKAEFPLKRIEQFYGRINKSKGEIKALDFESTNGDTYSYKAKFKKDILDIVINVDQDSLINSLVIKRPKRDFKRN